MKILEIDRNEVSRDEAISRFKEIGDEYKLELIDAIPADAASIDL